MSESTSVDIESVGLAEATLQKLLHERKSLEHVGEVLKVYREASAQMVHLEKQLDQGEKELATLLETIEAAKDKYVSEKEKTDKYMKDMLIRGEAEIDAKLKHKRAEYDTVVFKIREAEKQYDGLVIMLNIKLEELNVKTEEAEKKFTWLQEQQQAIVATILKASASVS